MYYADQPEQKYGVVWAPGTFQTNRRLFSQRHAPFAADLHNGKNANQAVRHDRNQCQRALLSGPGQQRIARRAVLPTNADGLCAHGQ